jgi:protein phosphatase
MPTPVKKFTIVFAAKSDIGLVRTENQDSFGKFPEDNLDLYTLKGQLFIVADGMGGHKGGKEASTIAVKVVNSEYFNSPYDESVALKEAIEKANTAIYNQSGDKSEFGRMGTTCSALILKDDKGIIGHVGDSRIYKIENNNIEQLTNDHTKVQEMLREGILTPEEAKNYPSKSVLARALGVDENVRIDLIEDIKLKKGQSYVLCSDGLAKVIKSEILHIVSNNTPSDACNILVDLANERGGKDNVTVLIIKVDPDQVKIQPVKPVKSVKKKVKIPVTRDRRKKSKGWLGVIIVFFIILVLVFILYKDSLFSTAPVEKDNNSARNGIMENGNKVKPTINLDDADKKLLDKANRLLKEKDYEGAFSIYKAILNDQPMHQTALKGVNAIASAYSSIADGLMNEKNFEEALKFYKKAEVIQPDNEKIKSQIRLCTSQLVYQQPGIDSSSIDTTPISDSESDSRITVSKFDLPGWNYPGINKNEFSINNNELNFTNTLGEKFIIYNKDLFDVTISINTEIENPNSVLGLIIGYVSQLDYYIFKYRDGGNYTLQRIKGNDIEKLLVIRPKDSGESNSRKMKIIYSDNLISIYDQNGLISSYKSVWGIFGKAGLYVDKNSSIKFQNILLSGKTRLD